MFVQIWQIFARLNISAQTDILLARSARDDFLNTVRLFQVSRSGVKCTTIPPLGFKYSVQKLHWLIMYVFLFLYQVSQLTESMRGDEQVIFWSLIWSVIRSLIKRFRRCTPSTTRLLTKKINWLTKPCLPSFYTCREKMCHFLRFVNEIEIQKYASISYRLRRN